MTIEELIEILQVMQVQLGPKARVEISVDVSAGTDGPEERLFAEPIELMKDQDTLMILSLPIKPTTKKKRKK